MGMRQKRLHRQFHARTGQDGTQIWTRSDPARPVSGSQSLQTPGGDTIVDGQQDGGIGNGVLG